MPITPRLFHSKSFTFRRSWINLEVDPTNIARITQQLRLGASRIFRKSELWIHEVNCIHTQKGAQLKSKLQQTGTLSDVADRPAACVTKQQYSSATLFSFPQGKTWRAFKNTTSFFLLSF
jgi:hypothetical protein